MYHNRMAHPLHSNHDKYLMEKSLLLGTLPKTTNGDVPLIVKQRLKNLTDIPEWDGYDDSRTPAEFVDQFFTSIAENMTSQEHIGQIFYAYIQKKCSTWAEAHRKWRTEPGELIPAFLKNFWNDTRKAEELAALTASEYNYKKYGSVAAYVEYWRRRLPPCESIKAATVLNLLELRVPATFQWLFAEERNKERPDFDEIIRRISERERQQKKSAEAKKIDQMLQQSMEKKEKDKPENKDAGKNNGYNNYKHYNNNNYRNRGSP